ncbi:MAG: 2OG-Fe(II) oxygenase, partial [Moorea sp. SIO3I7]|nr:2OG-Fe(II) oxygenase [Moorena sp. SIO3I7]
PHFVGGGLHQIEKGGYLKIHADFNRHTKLRLDRRLNLLIYLNKDWQEDYGGHFEMWDTEMTQSQKKILPVFNRCVIFSTTDFSYHGHPEPLTCPEGRTRKSLALYYYSNGRPAEELSKSGDHSTLFKARPGEKLQLKKSPVTKVKNFLKKLILE